MQAEATRERTWVDDTDPLFHRTVSPYRAKGCVYLRSAVVDRVDERIVSTGSFGIDESCYIDDTGHFNAAEFIICYNQLLYVSLATAVTRSLAPEFEHWTIDHFWERQLPDVLIHKLSSVFSRPINARSFTGEFTIRSISTRSLARGMLTLDTEIKFHDDHGGRSRGDVSIALVNVPAAPGTSP